MDDTPQIVAPAIVEAAPSIEHAPTLGFSWVSVGGRYFSIDYAAISASYHLWSRRGFELAIGGKLGLGPARRGIPALGEGFLSAAIVPQFSTSKDAEDRTMSWRPTLGFELGVSSASAQYEPSSALQDHFVRASPPPGWFYAQAFAKLARFRLSSFHASILGFGVGVPLDQFGRYLRTEFELLQVGRIL